MTNINDSYFDGYYKDIWRAIIPPELTRKEVEFMVDYFQLSAESNVLDIMCGYGRHALGLAEKGIPVTAMDNLEDYITEIKSKAKEASIPVNAIEANIADYKPTGLFDLAICMGNSLNFFPEQQVRNILATVHNTLKPGGHLLVHSWSIAEIAIPEFKDRTWSKLGELKFVAESSFLFQPTRIETEHLILSPGKPDEIKNAIDYIFSIAEMERMFDLEGYHLEHMFSIPGRKNFTIGDPRIYFVAQKKNDEE